MHSLIGILICMWIYVSSQAWEFYCVETNSERKCYLDLVNASKESS